tara:strand:+ start:445 stop:714 length:270 start_codon:yes stop_codon:yes gene_type:complete
MNDIKLNADMINWLDKNKSDYQNIAIDNQTFPSDAVTRMNQISKSPHSMAERRLLLKAFCEQFNMLPYSEGVPVAIKMIDQWQHIKKYK